MHEHGASPSPLSLMPQAGQLTLKDIAWCAGVEPPRLRKWAADGRLGANPPFSEYDALEAAVAFSMTTGGVSQKIATEAWDVVRSDVKRLLLSQTSDMWLVVSADGPEAEVWDDRALVVERASCMGRCWVVNPSEAQARARSRFALLQSRLTPAAGEVKPMRSVRSVRSAG
jgi:hypothetical protein